MSAIPDKDYIDARMDTMRSVLDGRLAAFEAMIEAKFTGVDTKFAEMRADMHRNTAEVIKWVVGTFIAAMAVFITVITFVLNNAVPKTAPAAAPAPLIFQLPAPAPAPAGQTGSAGIAATPLAPSMPGAPPVSFLQIVPAVPALAPKK